MISINVKKEGELHKTILEAVRIRIRESAKVHNTRLKKWRAAEELFVGYMPEKEVDAARRAKREAGKPDYTTIQIPYSYAVAMSAHSYWSSVFLSRSPVFQYMGTTDEGEMQIQAVEALINYQVGRARMMPNLFIHLQDVAKYGEAWVSNYWKTEMSRVSELYEEEEKYLGMIKTGNMIRKKRVREIVGYQGNALSNIHPGKIFTDPRYPRNRFQDGEFAAVQTTLSRNQLLEGGAIGQYINVEHLPRKATVNSNEVSTDYSTSEDLERPDTQSITESSVPTANNVYDVFEMHVNLVPKDWKLGKGDLPEKWVFTVDSQFTTVLECRPLGCIHNKYPLTMLEIEPEGYMQFSRGLVEIFGPIQNTLDWLVNSHLFNVRQTMNNQFVFDPSKIYETDVASRDPGKAMRLKPAAYGTDVRQALVQIPVADVTGNHLNDMQMMYQMGERLGISDSVMGVGNPSSRRTAQEVRGSQAFSVGRLKTISEYFSATGFQDLSSMMLMNSQQYYDGSMKLKIAGNAADLAGAGFIEVTPEMIAGQYGWEPVDGSLPADRYAQANLWRDLIGQMAQVPQVVGQYDLGKIFGYVAQLAGIKNLNRFKVEVVSDGQAMADLASGNGVAINGANMLEPGQVAGNGPTA